MCATRLSRSKVVKILLEAGADMEAKDEVIFTIHYWALPYAVTCVLFTIYLQSLIINRTLARIFTTLNIRSVSSC